MHIPFRHLLFCFAVQLAVAAPAEKLTVSSKVESLGPKTGKLVLAFKPDPQYDFNRTPPFTVEVEPRAGIEWQAPKLSPKDGKPKAGSQYYGEILPVEFPYTLSAGAPIEARAKVTYFYCSKKDGFCARETKPVLVTIRPGS